jgi:hypothetical protein
VRWLPSWRGGYRERATPTDGPLGERARRGEELDLADGGSVDRETMASWPASRRVSATMIRDLLCTTGQADPRSVRLRGAHIVGEAGCIGRRGLRHPAAERSPDLDLRNAHAGDHARYRPSTPSQLDLADLDAQLVAGFLDHLEHQRGNSVRTRNARLAAVHSLFRFAALTHPDWLNEQPGNPDDPLFPTRRGNTLSRDAIEHRLAHYATHAAKTCPSLRGKTVTAHVLRHTTAMRLLHAGVDTSVIALWLGHVSVETTQIYLHADLKLKEKALARTRPPNSRTGRYQPPDRLLAWPEVPRHVSGRVRCGDPSGSFLFRAVLRDRLAKKLILVLRGAPAAVDVELDAVVSGIRRRFAQGLEQIGVEVGYAGILVIKHCHAVGEGTVSLGSRTTVVATKDFAERGRR